MKRIVYSIILTTVLWATANSQTEEWKLDRSHSNITFGISYMVIAQVVGSFKDFEIRAQASKEDFSDLEIEAIAKTASINTENERRDNHLRSDDFFNAERFPEIRFTSNSIEMVGEKSYKIRGELTIRDVTREVSFDAVLNGAIRTGKSFRAGWQATLTINRFDFGLKWDRAIETGGLVAGKDVKITINVALIKEIAS